MSNAKSRLKNIGSGLLAVASVAVYAPTMNKVRELDEQIAKLQKERDELNESLPEDYRI